MLSRRRFLSTTAAMGAALATQRSQQAIAQVDRRMIVDAEIHLWKAESDDWKWVPGAQPQLPVTSGVNFTENQRFEIHWIVAPPRLHAGALSPDRGRGEMPSNVALGGRVGSGGNPL